MQLDGTGIADVAPGLVVAANGVKISNMHISGFGGDGIMVVGSESVEISKNWIVENGKALVRQPGLAGRTFGHSLFGKGISIYDSNTILISGNKISGNANRGISVKPLAGASLKALTQHNIAKNDIRYLLQRLRPLNRVEIRENLIGVDVSGHRAVPNQGGGIALEQTSDSTIKGNVISGNSLYGLVIAGRQAARNRVIGNLIGTDIEGDDAIPNGRSGLVVFNAPDNLIGGRNKGEGNVISGNRRHGVNIDGSATRVNGTVKGGCGWASGNRVTGNLIGLTSDGLRAMPNGKQGVLLFYSQGNQIGGLEYSEQANIVAANKSNGIAIIGHNPARTNWRIMIRGDSGKPVQTVSSCEYSRGNLVTSKNIIVGNYIGYSPLAKKAFPNQPRGILVAHSSENHVKKNVIVPGDRGAVVVTGKTAFGNSVEENEEIKY